MFFGGNLPAELALDCNDTSVAKNIHNETVLVVYCTVLVQVQYKVPYCIFNFNDFINFSSTCFHRFDIDERKSVALPFYMLYEVLVQY